MSRHARVRTPMLGLLLAPGLALACGEGMFLAGNGLQFQSYLAPRPAAVLIYAPVPEEGGEQLHAGLDQAGHRLTVVGDPAELERALAGGRFDVVIADFEGLRAMPDGLPQGTRVLPVVPRSLARSAEVRGRFALFLTDGAGLDQHLEAIDRLVSGS